jgi:aminopeptidase N
VLCQHGFPRFASDDGTVQAGEQCLQTGGLAGSLRRLLADQLDDLRRARRVRSAGQAQ